MDNKNSELIFVVGERITVTHIKEDDACFFSKGASGVVKELNGDDALVKFDSGEFNKESDSEWWVGLENVDVTQETTPQLPEDTVYFAKVKPNATVPSKESHNAGYDTYANFEEDNLIIQPHETKMIPTGIASALDEKYYFQLFERGSTGVKGMGQRSGCIDSGYRGEWFVPITNHNTKPLIITKEVNTEYLKDDYIVYPYSKAICQAVLLEVPKADVVELTYDELLKIESERGNGALGSSGK